jgi:integrase
MKNMKEEGEGCSSPASSTKIALEINAVSKSRPKRRSFANALFSEFLNKTISTVYPLYKPARLFVPEKGNEWYIEYYYLIPGSNSYHRFKERFDINRIKNIAEKRQYGKAIVDFINKKLAEGFNPFAAKKKTGSSPVFVVGQVEEVYIEMCADVSKNTQDTYLCMKNRFVNFINENSLEKISVLQVSSEIVDHFQDYLLAKKLSPKTINSTMSHLGMFWDIAKKNKIAFSNPFRDIIPIRRKNSSSKAVDKFEPLTTKEVQVIMDHLQTSEDKNFMYFISMIYLAWARPVEIRRLRVSQIDLINDYIVFKKAETKNERGAYVQIVPSLKKLLLQMNLDQYPKDYFLFAKGFLPGIKPITEKRAQRMWISVVRETLGIDKAMYAFKHTGNIEYLQNNKGNVNLKWQQAQNRHSSAAMTERYNRQLGAYFIDTSDVKLGVF